MGIRQTALPLGAGLAAAGLPPLAAARGLDAAFGVLVGACLLSAVVVVALVREGPAQQAPAPGRALPDARVLRVAAVSLLLVVPQFAVVAFLVVYLVDEQDVGVAAAALLLAAVQLAGGASRVVVGRWSDRLGRRLQPLRRIAVAVAVVFAVLALLAARGGRSSCRC